jgi:TPR repeat protein
MLFLILEFVMKMVQDLNKAVEYYKRAAEFDNPSALFNLANCYLNGDGTNPDYKKAIKLYHRIIELAEDSQTYCTLFHLYSSVIGVEKDLSQSIQFLIKSANLLYQESFVQIGLFLLNGNFIDKNEEKAVSYFKKSSEKNESQGLFWYGFCLIKAKGIQKNLYLGRDFIERSIEQKFFLAKLFYSSIKILKHHYT